MRWIIGDIHGMLQPLATVLLAVRKQDPQARFLFVGDYVNRGPDSRSVIELLLALQSEGAARFARGNHDDIFDLLLNGHSLSSEIARTDPLQVFAWFMQHGLANTLNSYGVDYAELLHLESRPSAPRLRSILNALPDSHRQFIRNLEPALEEPEFFVAHAMWDVNDHTDDPGLVERMAGHPARKHRILWGRYSLPEIRREKLWQRPGYFGHTPVANYAVVRPTRNVPIEGPSIVLLDTAAALGSDGRLTAYCADTHQFLQSDVHGRMVNPEPAAEVK